MTCWKCNAFFCWVCNTELRKNDPYSHYRDVGSQCFNKLYHGYVDEDDDNDYENEGSDEDEEQWFML